MINASTLALLNHDAAQLQVTVSMRVVCAVAVDQLPGGVDDPTEEECIGMRAGGCFALLFAEGTGRDRLQHDFTEARAKHGRSLNPLQIRPACRG